MATTKVLQLTDYEDNKRKYVIAKKGTYNIGNHKAKVWYFYNGISLDWTDGCNEVGGFFDDEMSARTCIKENKLIDAKVYEVATTVHCFK